MHFGYQLSIPLKKAHSKARHNDLICVPNVEATIVGVVKRVFLSVIKMCN
jgi:hypothetical protein